MPNTTAETAETPSLRDLIERLWRTANSLEAVVQHAGSIAVTLRGPYAEPDFMPRGPEERLSGLTEELGAQIAVLDAKVSTLAYRMGRIAGAIGREPELSSDETTDTEPTGRTGRAWGTF